MRPYSKKWAKEFANSLDEKELRLVAESYARNVDFNDTYNLIESRRRAKENKKVKHGISGR